MKTALLIDIGSTYTKASLFELDRLELIGRSQAHTTVDTDVNDGLKEALEGLTGWKKADYKLACSSAAGGLKIVAIGLVPELTAEAAKRAALGAGSKVLATYSYHLTSQEVREIEELNCDLILLAGGTDGGNQETIIHNANLIAASNLDQPVVVAGNKSAAEDVLKVFKDGGKEAYLTENVMPELEELNILPARKMIRELFLKRIIHARGLDRVNQLIEGVIMPTPAAVLKAAVLLADGTAIQPGLGELMVVDIGGATTDVHSIASGKPTQAETRLRGLKEPYQKRTVEGDLGMRYSISTLYKAVGREFFRNQLKELGYKKSEKYKYESLIHKLELEKDYIVNRLEEMMVENLLAKNAARLAVERHVGRIKTVFTPMGALAIQEGKDLTGLEVVIGTGGIIVNNSKPEFILSGTLYENMNQPELLAPVKPRFLLDREYIMAACGLLAEVEPDLSLRLMKKYLYEISVNNKSWRDKYGGRE